MLLPLLDGAARLVALGLIGIAVMAAGVDLRLVHARFGPFALLGWLAEIATALHLQLAVGFAIALVWFAARQRWWWGAALAPFALLTASHLAPYWWPRPAIATPATSLRIASLNLWRSNPSSGVARDWLLAQAPDVIFLAELRVHMVDSLVPLADAYPYRLSDEAGGIALLSRHPLTRIDLDDRRIIAARLCVADGRCIQVIGAHPMAPFGAPPVRERDATLATIAALARGSGEPVVVMGDLNTTPWTPGFRGLIAAGLADSAWGRGISGTWNARLFWLRVPIDHVLTGNRAVSLARTRGPDVGSDHFPITATIGF